MQTERDKILQRVLNLRARAEDNGSSEAEMNTALTMCMKLMDAYSIEEAELALAEGTGRIKLEIVTKEADTSILKGSSHKHKVLLSLGAISDFTHTQSVYWSQTGSVNFTGHRPDVELANYLLAVIREALDREYDNYWYNNRAVGYGAKTAFQTAMASRVNSRLRDMARESEQTRQREKQLAIENSSTQSSTALIIAEINEQKRKAVAEAYAKAHPKVRTVKTNINFGKNITAHVAGRNAGDRLNLSKAVSSSKLKLIA